MTGEDGIFTVQQLRPGVYGVHFDLPATLASMAPGDAIGVTVPQRFGASLGCSVEFPVTGAGILAGQVTDASGSGVKGILTVDLPGGQGRTPAALLGFTNADGSFRVNHLDAGDYLHEFSASKSRGAELCLVPRHKGPRKGGPGPSG